MLKTKKIICFIVCLLVFIVVLVFIDQKTTYMVAVNQNNVEVSNENIVIEMSSGTSVGYFKKAELEEIDDGISVYVMAVNEEERLTALKLVQDLRWCEVKTEMDYLDKGLKAQFKQADRLKARLLIILNSEDLQKGLMTVKDNLTKEEIKVDENEILDYIISNL